MPTSTRPLLPANGDWLMAEFKEELVDVSDPESDDTRTTLARHLLGKHRATVRDHPGFSAVTRRGRITGQRPVGVPAAGDTVPVTAPQTGEVWQAQIFVSVLGASGYLYAEATRSQDLASWLGAHVRALEFYGGSARVVVPDNLKSGVTKACWYEPGLNASYLELARAYGLAVLPARPARPQDKGAVEAGVHVAENWVLAPLRKRRFFSLGELNAALAEQVAMVNDRRFRGQPVSRRALFEELERGALRPLPATRYEFALWKPAKVNMDYHVEFDTRFYSVPHRLVREAVEVRATASVVEIFHRSRRVTSHVREYGRRRFITQPEHMPAAHRAHLEWTPSGLVAWGRSVGPAVAQVVETILNTRPLRSMAIGPALA